jgi:hypothetical protein
VIDTVDLLLAAAADVRLDGEASDPLAWRDAAVLGAVESAWQRGDLDRLRALADGYGRLLMVLPRLAGGRVVIERVGTGERRRRGAFATPDPVAAALAAWALPGELAGGRASAAWPRVVDPACGTGALLRAALRRLTHLGATPAQAGGCLYGVDADRVAVEVCRAVLAAELTELGHPCRPADLAARLQVGDALLGPTPCTPVGEPAEVGQAPPLAWHAAFPEALDVDGAPAEPVTGWRGGFDAVVANPPWERLKVHARDWNGVTPQALRDLSARTARAVRGGGRHPLTGAGEINAYLPFIETCWRLLGPAGRAALVVPQGFASDRSAARLIEALVDAGALRRLHLLDPQPIFDGVSSRMGVALVELHGGPCAARASGGPAAEVAVGLGSPLEPVEARAWNLDAGLLRLVNPNTGTVPLFGSAADARIVAGVHRRLPVLRRRDAEGGEVVDDPWQLRLVTPLHMTRDARWFSSRPGPGLLPLWEAKHTWLLDHRGGSRAEPRYWVSADLVAQRFGDLAERGWLGAYRNVATAQTRRTLVPCALPVVGVGNSLPLLAAPRLPLLLAALASMPADHLMRQRHAGANLNFFKLEQLPLPPPSAYDAPAPWDPGTTVAAWVLERFAAAVAWAEDLAGLAEELRRDGVPGVPAGGVLDLPAEAAARRREAALADLDAAHAVLLGLDRDDLVHVLGTFTALRAAEQRRLGRYAAAERVLAAYDRLTLREG